MTTGDPGEWREALRTHEREIERLRGEIALLEQEQRDGCDPDSMRGLVRVRIEFATAQLTRHNIGAALMAARLRSRG